MRCNYNIRRYTKELKKYTSYSSYHEPNNSNKQCFFLLRIKSLTKIIPKESDHNAWIITLTLIQLNG